MIIPFRGVTTIFGINYMKQHFTHHQRYIIVAIISMFLPFYMCAIVIAFLTIRLLITGEIQDAYKRIPRSRFIIIFCLLSLIVSLYYQNYYGVACIIALLVFFSFMLFYRVYITHELFDFITDLLIVLSIFAAFYGLVEYIGVLNDYEINQFEVIIFNSPQDRINSVFFNANYYAMMIEFFVCLIFYKILKMKDYWHHMNYLIYYIFAIILNLFLLVLTGCRTAWPALAVGIVMMLLLDKHYKTCGVILAGVLGGCGYFILNPEKFPRFDNIIAYFKTRENIWTTAIANIKTHFLFGEGPMTYMHIYNQYNGHPTQHAHSVYLDPLLCFGIVGLASIVPYVISMLKGIYHLFSRKLDLELFALIIAYILIVLIHGTMDYTIFFVQTGLLFLLICSSYEVYTNES